MNKNFYKNVTYIVSLFFLLAGTMGCSDFLDRYPLDKQTEETAFDTYDNFKTYAWGCYGFFRGFDTYTNTYDIESSWDEQYSDNMIYAGATQISSPYAYQLKTVPTTSTRWNRTFEYVRKANVMLKNIDGASMTETEKDHWRSVGYFFRTLYHFDLLKWYGDIPWVDHVITDTDLEILFGPRISRTIVTQNMIDDLKWAETHIKPAGDGTNTVNKQVVRALLSRITLFEGTWEKYHGISDGSAFLNECIRVSAALLGDQSVILSNYNEKYNSMQLGGKAGILLCKEYATDIMGHRIGRVTRTNAWNYSVTKDVVDSYLCIDGRPVSTSTVYDGDRSMYDQFRNRDRRLYFTVLPPYRVTVGPSTIWTYTNNPGDREYIDLMAGLSGNGTSEKRLPAQQFAGNYVAVSPHIQGVDLGGHAAVCNKMGFYFWKYYNTHQVNQALGVDTENFPLFTIEEVMLNYAEAACERGEFTQNVADITINKLRPRANLPNMAVVAIDAGFDTNRDQSVNPLLWEVRRERRSELMGDGFRFDDLKRWKKGEYVNKENVYLGVYIKRSDFNNPALSAVKALKKGDAANEGYVWWFDMPPGWLDKYYLEPLPTNEVALNPNLLPDNPGWEE
jgi:hypothetical protein